ncbi:MAG TPA: hypothetical protein PK728_11130 [Bacillota bacterium]|nr:hypothetical protein [Bacillota bacterium]
MAKTSAARTAPGLQPILYLNLRPFFVGGLFLAVFTAPFMRGLFFQPELLEMQMLVTRSTTNRTTSNLTFPSWMFYASAFTSWN